MKCYALFILHFGLLFKGGNCAQQFEKQPEYNEVNPGQECRLTCKILNKKGQCSWQKDNKPVGIYLGKYEWGGNPDVGDCSLRILSAALEYDDGEWECQVTASDFAAQDALTSRPVKLVVRVPPNAPQIEFNGTQIPMGKNLTTAGGSRTSVKCISRYGNPPPFLKWFVGDDEIVGVNQTNKTEEDNAKKWSATSVLDYTFVKNQNGKGLRCVAVHEAYPTKSRHTQVTLDVQYGPDVKVVGTPEGDLEENKTPLTLRCIADANPAPQVSWRRVGGSQTYSFQETIEFRPLLRKHSGTYVCEAKNFLGTAQTPPTHIDVKYPPKVSGVRPDGQVSANLYNRTVLQCQADGNPPPTYEWIQKVTPTTTTEEATYIRGSDPMLVILNVTYDYQGKYFCKASNIISGTQRTTLSNPIDLSVYGAPQILRHYVDRDVGVEKGGNALMNIIFCSNPAPSRAVWEWGSVQLEAGVPMGRFKADKIQKTPRDDCYEAKFRISDADNSDSRHYYLNVENDRGIDKYSTNLQVRGFDLIVSDPVAMSTVIGVIGGSLILLVLVVMVILYAFKTDKWCFSQRGDFKPTDLESEKSDMDGSERDERAHALGKSSFGGIPASELQFPHHHHLRGNSPIAAPLPRKSRTPQPILSPDLHVTKDHRGERGFRGRSYPTEPRKDINYADLQLPKSSNNGSMKKTRNQQFLHQQQYQQQLQQQQNHQRQLHDQQLQQQQLQQQHHFPSPAMATAIRRQHGDVQFKPKANEQAEV